ncbi:MAG: septum formation initiator family protein [Lachnospiraceae bacterium]|nr:septum formation initiator family protein [Lachnospiraceae bacterium]
MKAKKQKRRFDIGTISIIVIVLLFLGIMSVQTYRLKQKDARYAEREQLLKEQYAEETQRSEELNELEAYTNSKEYIKDKANELGYVFENEIIFKESDE